MLKWTEMRAYTNVEVEDTVNAVSTIEQNYAYLIAGLEVETTAILVSMRHLANVAWCPPP